MGGSACTAGDEGVPLRKTPWQRRHCLPLGALSQRQHEYRQSETRSQFENDHPDKLCERFADCTSHTALETLVDYEPDPEDARYRQLLQIILPIESALLDSQQPMQVLSGNPTLSSADQMRWTAILKLVMENVAVRNRGSDKAIAVFAGAQRAVLVSLAQDPVRLAVLHRTASQFEEAIAKRIRRLKAVVNIAISSPPSEYLQPDPICLYAYSADLLRDARTRGSNPPGLTSQTRPKAQSGAATAIMAPCLKEGCQASISDAGALLNNVI
jgi:hypothetical protein